MGKFRIAYAFFLLLAAELTLAPAGEALPARRFTARQLVRTVESALAGVAQTAEDPAAGLNSSAPGSAAFRSALAGMRLRVSQVESALDRREKEFFLLVDQGSADLGSLRVAWARAGVQNDTITQGLRVVSASYRTLRSHYGREGLRYRQGGELTAAEKRQFQRLQQANQRFVESLRLLRERAERRQDSTTVAELDRFRSEAERIAWARLSLEAYLNALIAASEMRGEWAANAPYIRGDAPEEFAAADETVRDLYVESDIGHVFTVDLGTAGWSQMELQTEPLAVPAQIFQLVEGDELTAEEETAAPEPDVSAPEEDADEAEAEADEEIDAESADPEGLEEAAELDDEILEEEDLAVAATDAVGSAPAALLSSEPAAKPDTGAPAGAESSKPGAEPAQPQPGSPPAGDPPIARPIG